MNLTDQLAEAIATFEGFFKPGSVAARNNNPGNLRNWGSTPVVAGYAKFGSSESGWAALKRQIDLNIGRGLTLREFFKGKKDVYAGYSPAADSNDPDAYAEFVAARLGVSADAPLASLPGVTSSPLFWWPSFEFPASGHDENTRELMLYGAAVVGVVAFLYLVLG